MESTSRFIVEWLCFWIDTIWFKIFGFEMISFPGAITSICVLAGAVVFADISFQIDSWLETKKRG